MPSLKANQASKQQMFGVHGKKTGYDFVGLVLDYNDETQMVTLQQRNYFKPGDEVEFFGPEMENVRHDDR